MKTEKLVSAILVILFFSHCATIKKPIWVKEFGQKTFSKDGIEGIGFASFNKKDKSSLRSARETAYNEAIKNLAIKLKTELKGMIEHKMGDKIVKIDKKYHTETVDQIDSLTNVMFESVLGRKYFEEYIDYKNSLYWVYVWTTKAELQKTINEELEKQELKNYSLMKLCTKQYKNAQKFILSGQLLNGLTILDQILTNLQEVKGISVVDDIDNISLYYEVKNKMLSLVSSLTLSADSENNIVTLLNIPLEVELKVLCKFSENGKEIKAINLPLKARFTKGSGEIEQSKLTDENGIAKFKVYKLTAKENEVEIYPDTDLIKDKKVIFYLTAQHSRELVKVSINVEGDDTYLSEFLKNEVLSKLKLNEFNIVGENPDYVISIKFHLEYLGNEILLPDGKKTSFAETYSGSATVEVANVQTKKIVLNKSFSGMTGFGKTEKMAKENSIKKLADAIADYIIKNFQ